MKKNTYLCIVLIVSIIFLFGIIHNSFFENVSDYKIHQSFITGAGNYKSVNLKVIVNINDYEMNQMFEMIRKEYVELNGEPDTLHIELFDSQYAFEHGESSGSMICNNR